MNGSVADFGKIIIDRGANVTADTVGATQKAAEAAAKAASVVGRRYHFRGRNGKRWPLIAKVDKARAFARAADRSALGRGTASPREFNAVAIVKADPMGFWAIAVRGRRGNYWVRPKGVGTFRSSLRGLRGRKRSAAAADFLSSGPSYRGLKPLRTPYGPRYGVFVKERMLPLDANLWEKAQDAARPVTRGVYDRALASSIRKQTARPVTLYVRTGGKLRKTA